MTAVANTLAGGDCNFDADTLRARRTARVLGCVVEAPSALDTLLRSFRWGHVLQLDWAFRKLLGREFRPRPRRWHSGRVWR